MERAHRCGRRRAPVQGVAGAGPVSGLATGRHRQTHCSPAAAARKPAATIAHSVDTVDGIPVVSVSGTVKSRATGPLTDVLTECIGAGGTNLIVDLSQVNGMTHAGARGLIVAAKLMEAARGRMRICGAVQPVETVLTSLGFNHLLKCDPTLRDSVAHLAGTGDTEEDLAERH